jgi:PBSX family phage terminase large subunit
LSLTVKTPQGNFSIGKNPSFTQREFINAAEREQLFGGAKRGGKSVSLCQKLILLSVNFPGNRLGLFRQDLPDLRESTLVTFFQMCPPALILNHHQTFRILTLRSRLEGVPSTIHYGGLGDLNNLESAKGKEYGEIAIDEPSEIDEATYLMLRAQLCWVLPDGSRPPYMMLMGSNPEPGWVYRRFRHLIDRASAEDPVQRDGNFCFVRSLPKDNPYLPPGWEDELRADYPPLWVEKYLNGSWEVSEGQVFKEFDRKAHCIKPLPEAFIKTLKLYGAIDHGTTGVTAFTVVGIDENDNRFVLAEYYQRNRLVSQHANDIKAVVAQFEKITGNRFEYILIDPSTTAKTQQGVHELFSIQDEYRRNGISTVAGWRASIEIGINVIAEHLHVNPNHIHPFAQAYGSPSLFIVEDNCSNLVREMMELKVNVTESGRLDYTGGDHALDCVRYIFMSRPKRPEFAPVDLSSMTPQSRFALKAHERWGARFDKSIKKREGEGSWF